MVCAGENYVAKVSLMWKTRPHFKSLQEFSSELGNLEENTTQINSLAKKFVTQIHKKCRLESVDGDGGCSTLSKLTPEIKVQLEINGVELMMEVDTEASISIKSENPDDNDRREFNLV